MLSRAEVFFFKAIPFINRKIPAVNLALEKDRAPCTLHSKEPQVSFFEHLVGVEKRVEFGMVRK